MQTKKASAETLQATVDWLGGDIVQDVKDALKAVDEMPGGMQEAAVNRLCDKLAEAKALAFSWMNDHGEP